MKKVKINSEEYYYNSLPTTQDDNHNGIEDRFELHHTTGRFAGKLIKYTDGHFATFSGTNGLNKAVHNSKAVVFVPIPKTKFTAGEWHIEENASHYPFIMGEDNNTIAMLFEKDGSLPYGRTAEETTANARLIAQAPKMYDMMQAVKSYLIKKAIELEFKEPEINDLIVMIDNIKHQLK